MSFEKQEIKELIIAIIIAGFVFSFNEWGLREFSINIGFINLIRAILIVAIIFTTRAYIQKQVAKYFDSTSKFRLLEIEPRIYRPTKLEEIIFQTTKKILNPIGVIITLLVTILSNGKLILVLLATAKITSNKLKRVGRKYIHIKDIEIAQIALAGPLTDLSLLAIFKLLLPIAPLFFEKAMFIAATLAVFHILPIPKMDGGQLFIGSKTLYVFGLIFTILFITAIYGLSILNALIIALIIAGLITLLFFYKFYKAKIP